MPITLAQASIIVDEALKKGRELDCAPLAVAVTDAGGHLVAFKREDRAGILKFDIAYGKAWGALGMGFGTRELAARAASNPAFLTRTRRRQRRPHRPLSRRRAHSRRRGTGRRRGRHLRRHRRPRRGMRALRHHRRRLRRQDRRLRRRPMRAFEDFTVGQTIDHGQRTVERRGYRRLRRSLRPRERRRRRAHRLRLARRPHLHATDGQFHAARFDQHGRARHRDAAMAEAGRSRRYRSAPARP